MKPDALPNNSTNSSSSPGIITITAPLPPTDGSLNVVRGFDSFPTDPPPEDVLLGKDWLRRGDIVFFNSGAGEGKSVALGQAAMALSLGLPWMGIQPAKPLRILHFVGEDDRSTLGQIREGFLENSRALTGRQLTRDDLLPLREVVRTDFSRQFIGHAFIDHVDQMLRDEPADLVLINPLLSFIGGEIVKDSSEFLRAGLMPVLQAHRAGVILAHHTVKLSKDSWNQMDFTYSGIGGSEVANVPRSVLTLAPTKTKGLHSLHVSKRQTTGWRDDHGRTTDRCYIKRTDNPSRPAWLPVTHEEADELQSQAKGNTGARKIEPKHVVEAVTTGDMQRKALLEQLCRDHRCGVRTAQSAYDAAKHLGLIDTYSEKNPRGGQAITWACIPGRGLQGAI
jgi:hypothetical protein